MHPINLRVRVRVRDRVRFRVRIRVRVRVRVRGLLYNYSKDLTLNLEVYRFGIGESSPNLFFNMLNLYLVKFEAQ